MRKNIAQGDFILSLSKEEIFENYLQYVLSGEDYIKAKKPTSIIGITAKRYEVDEAIQPNDIIYVEGHELPFKEYSKFPAELMVTIMRRNY